jgi:2-hydroxychromene-2-carboxylate isomerase
MTDADLRFWFDPVCPFAWMTSKWVRMVAAQREYAVEWRSISLRLLNRHLDYDAHFPPEYEAGHTAGLRLLRVAARTRAEHGPEAVASLYAACGAHIFEVPPEVGTVPERLDRGELLPAVLADAGLPLQLGHALEDSSWDEQIQASTDEALSLTGKDVGTPILHFQPPEGVAFFGPVISRLPDEQDAVRLWDHVVGLAGFPGFAELKRSLREQPQLPSFGVAEGAVGRQEDWHGGSRRQKK